MSPPVLGFAGMTHLGLCSAVAAAEKGFRVVCFDPDAIRINGIESGQLPVVEPLLSELTRTHKARLRFTSKPDDLRSCDLVYVAPDVPTDDQGRSNLSAIESLLACVEEFVSDEAVLVILSQVPPGFTRRHLRPGRSLYYQVETLIFGRAVERALKPERIIIGSPNQDQELPPAYQTFLSAFDCPILVMQYESAELAKIAINMCLVASISVANTMAELCEEIGARWSEIVPALRLDRRIGEHAYLTPGLGIAGGNLERDLATVCRLAEQTGSDAGVVRAWIANSHQRRDWALRILHREVLHQITDPRIALLGLAYKQDTASTKNSPSLALIKNLPPVRLVVYDPVVPVSAASRPGAEEAESALGACQGADAVVIMTPWREFSEIEPKTMAQVLKGRCVIDPFGVFDPRACVDAGLDYFTLGSPAAPGQAK